jgi:HupF/HypC family
MSELLADDLAAAALSLARRFAAGATMWCASPQWPAHGQHVAVEFVQRSEPWGLASLWLGAGPRPAAGGADHVLWIDEADPGVAARSGDLVMLYHLLRELTHVVFEHPGLLHAEPGCTDDICVTCADEGRLAELTAVDDTGRAQVVVSGLPETIDVRLVDPVAPGDLVLVHAGVAIALMQSLERR